MIGFEMEAVKGLSDTELLDAVERLLRVPDFIDLNLGYDPETNEFYAGCEGATNLRALLRSVLVHNRPEKVSLSELLPLGRDTERQPNSSITLNDAIDQATHVGCS
jgi:hypothetical protein